MAGVLRVRQEQMGLPAQLDQPDLVATPDQLVRPARRALLDRPEMLALRGYRATPGLKGRLDPAATLGLKDRRATQEIRAVHLEMLALRGHRVPLAMQAQRATRETMAMPAHPDHLGTQARRAFKAFPEMMVLRVLLAQAAMPDLRVRRETTQPFPVLPVPQEMLAHRALRGHLAMLGLLAPLVHLAMLARPALPVRLVMLGRKVFRVRLAMLEFRVRQDHPATRVRRAPRATLGLQRSLECWPLRTAERTRMQRQPRVDPATETAPHTSSRPQGQKANI